MAFETDIFTGCDGLFYCIAAWSNTVTEGYFWTIILLTLGIVLFMGTFQFGVRRAFGYSSMSIGFLSLTLIQLGLIPMWILTLILITSGIGLAVLFIGEK